MSNVEITQELAVVIHNYLKKRPFDEVEQAMTPLRQAIAQSQQSDKVVKEVSQEMVKPIKITKKLKESMKGLKVLNGKARKKKSQSLHP